MLNFIGYISVCYIEEPFICNIKGDFTIESLKTIESNLIKNEYGFNYEYKGKELVTFAVNYIKDEIQYGTGYGDINIIPSYYDLTCMKVI